LGTENTTIKSTCAVLPFEVSGNNITFQKITFKNENTFGDGVTLNFNKNTSNIKIIECGFTGRYGRINVNEENISDISVNKCFFEECMYGILVNGGAYGTKRLTIVDNIFKNMIGDGIELNLPNDYGIGISGVVVSNNIYQKDLDYMIDNGLIEPLGGHGLIGSDCAGDVVVTGNTIDGFGFAGIDFEGKCHNILISNNKIKNAYGGGKNYFAGDYIEKGDFISVNNNIYWAKSSGVAGLISNLNVWHYNKNYMIGDYVYVDENTNEIGEVYICTTGGITGKNPQEVEKNLYWMVVLYGNGLIQNGVQIPFII
jgi:hypothetical protein